MWLTNCMSEQTQGWEPVSEKSVQWQPDFTQDVFLQSRVLQVQHSPRHPCEGLFRSLLAPNVACFLPWGRLFRNLRVECEGLQGKVVFSDCLPETDRSFGGVQLESTEHGCRSLFRRMANRHGITSLQKYPAVRQLICSQPVDQTPPSLIALRLKLLHVPFIWHCDGDHCALVSFLFFC